MSRRMLLLAPLLLPALLSGQSLLVVDEAGGPGSHYRDLPQAVAAAPSGSHLLVRPGNYDFFQVSGKALHIRGSGVNATRVNSTLPHNPLSIAAVPAGHTFVLEELVVYGTAFSRAPILQLGTGRILLREVKISTNNLPLFPIPQGRGLVEIADSVVHATGLEIDGGQGSAGSMPAALFATGSLLQLHRSRIAGLWSQGTNSPSMHGQAGLHLVRSTAELFQCQVFGGRGSDRSHLMSGGPGWGGDGGPGALLESGSLALVDGGSIRGGAKGVVQTMVWNYPGLNFGDGLVVQAGAAARLRAANLAPGGTGAQRWTGAGVLQEFGLPLNRPELLLTRTSLSPDGLRLQFQGAPGRPVLLAASQSAFWMPLGPLGLEGTLHLDPSRPGLFFLGAFTTPAVLMVPPLPLPGVVGPWWLQAFMAPDGAQTISSNPVQLSLWP